MENQVPLGGREVTGVVLASVVEVEGLQDLLQHQATGPLILLQPTAAHRASLAVVDALFARGMALRAQDDGLAGDDQTDGALKDLGEAPFQGRPHVRGTSLPRHGVLLRMDMIKF